MFESAAFKPMDPALPSFAALGPLTSDLTSSRSPNTVYGSEGRR